MNKATSFLLAAVILIAAFTGCSGNNDILCSNCGGKVAEEALFCSQCGHSVSSEISGDIGIIDAPDNIDKTDTSADESAAPVEPDTVFVPRKPGDISVLQNAASWASAMRDSINDLPSVTEPDSNSELLFKEANDAYKAGNFTVAEEKYLAVLEAYPTHSGAINNLSLCYMYLYDYEKSLGYSILNLLLHPDFSGTWVNILVSAHALGFAPGTLTDFLIGEYYSESIVYDGFIKMLEEYEDVIAQYYFYNESYADMEYADANLDDIESFLLEQAELHPEDKDVVMLLEYLSILRDLRENQN